jgi:hypothetical protein
MKKAIIVIGLLFSTFINVHSQVFDGVKIEGNVQTVVNAFKTRGYIIKKATNEVTEMTGTLAGERVELLVVATPKTKLACRVAVYFPKDENWYSLKSDYRKYVELLTDKYSEPDNNFEFWRSPYYEGDGYEISALANEKVVFATYWLNRNNMNVGLSISKYKQLCFTYENVRNTELANNEREQMLNNSF